MHKMSTGAYGRLPAIALLLTASYAVVASAAVHFPAANMVRPQKARSCLLKKFDSPVPQDRKVGNTLGSMAAAAI